MVSITSQGQISIPAPIRQKLGLNKLGKALVTEQSGSILIKPIKDFLELRGSLKTSKSSVNSKKIRALFEQHLAKHSIKDLQ